MVEKRFLSGEERVFSRPRNASQTRARITDTKHEPWAEGNSGTDRKALSEGTIGFTNETPDSLQLNSHFFMRVS
jgi:hypothetical protein